MQLRQRDMRRRYETPDRPLAVVIVLVWIKLAGFSGYDEKWGRRAAIAGNASRARKQNPRRDRDRDGACLLLVLLRIDLLGNCPWNSLAACD